MFSCIVYTAYTHADDYYVKSLYRILSCFVVVSNPLFYIEYDALFDIFRVDRRFIEMLLANTTTKSKKVQNNIKSRYIEICNAAAKVGQQLLKIMYLPLPLFDAVESHPL